MQPRSSLETNFKIQSNLFRNLVYNHVFKGEQLCTSLNQVPIDRYGLGSNQINYQRSQSCSSRNSSKGKKSNGSDKSFSGSTQIAAPNRKGRSLSSRSESFSNDGRDIIVSWTSQVTTITLLFNHYTKLLNRTFVKMTSVKKGSKHLQLSVRANRKVTKPTIVHWKAISATIWAKHQNLHGTIKIDVDNDRGVSNITLNNLEDDDTTSRNVFHKRSIFEIPEIDQIVLQLQSIEEDAGVFKESARWCFISILDDCNMTNQLNILQNQVIDMEGCFTLNKCNYDSKTLRESEAMKSEHRKISKIETPDYEDDGTNESPREGTLLAQIDQKDEELKELNKQLAWLQNHVIDLEGCIMLGKAELAAVKSGHIKIRSGHVKTPDYEDQVDKLIEELQRTENDLTLFKIHLNDELQRIYQNINDEVGLTESTCKELAEKVRLLH